jgi:hypothetical protein
VTQNTSFSIFGFAAPRHIRNKIATKKREREDAATMVDTMLLIKPETEILFSISQSEPPPKAYLTLTHKGGSSCDPMAFKVSNSVAACAIKIYAVYESYQGLRSVCPSRS